MKRILHIVGTMDRAGAETMVMNLYRAIDKTKFQFDFVYFTNKHCDYDDEITSLGGKIYRVVASNPIKRMLLMRNVFKTNNYQIIHSHTNFSSAFHIMAGVMAGVKVRITHSHSTSDLSKSALVRLLYHNVSKIVINIFSSRFLSCGKEASKLLFYNYKKAIVIPNSVDVNLLNEIGKSGKNYLNNEFGMNSDVIKIIQVGRLANEKNHLFSIDIAKQLKEDNVEFKMFFIGRGELNDDLQHKVAINGLSEDILFLDVRDDIPFLMAAADILLMPSLYEGFPVVLVEAQAVGIRCLVSDTVAAEVDLHVGLIEFLSLDNLSDWTKNITANQNIDFAERVLHIKKQGFDIKTNVKLIETVYENN